MADLPALTPGYIPAPRCGRFEHGDDWQWKRDAPKIWGGLDEQMEAEAAAKREADDLMAAYSAKWGKWFGGNVGWLLPERFVDGVPDYGVPE